MKIKKIIKIVIFTGLVLAALFFGYQQAQAKGVDDVKFPVEELGNCDSKENCKAYCDDPANIEKCLAFAEKNNLMKSEEINQARNYAKLVKSKVEFPGGAKNPAKAREYCNDPSHMEECITFAEKHGFINKAEVQEAKKFISIIKSGGTPGGCKTREECEKYCQDEGKFDECLEFGKKHGLIKADEVEKFKEFREKGGPGGCKTKEECSTFCNGPANQETCLEFAEKQGFAKREDIKNVKESMGHMRARIAENPELKQCITSNVDEGVLEKMGSGEFMPNIEVAESMKGCFEKFQSQIQEQARSKLDEAKPEVKECIQSAVGDGGVGMLREGQAVDPAAADQVRACFEGHNSKEDPRDRERGEFNREGKPEMAGQGMPEAVRECVQAKVGDLSNTDPAKLGAASRSCADEARNARPKEFDEQAEKDNQERKGLLERFRDRRKEEEKYKEQFKDNAQELERRREEFRQNEGYKQEQYRQSMPPSEQFKEEPRQYQPPENQYQPPPPPPEQKYDSPGEAQ